MNHRSRSDALLVALALPLVGAAGCTTYCHECVAPIDDGGDAASAPDDRADTDADAATDARSDLTEVATDAGDAAQEASSDAAMDAAMDAPSDAPADTLTDAPADASACPPTAALCETFESFPVGSTWLSGQTHGSWQETANNSGGGAVVSDGTHALEQAATPPASATDHSFAAATSGASFGDLDATVRVRVLTQFGVDGGVPATNSTMRLQWHGSVGADHYELSLQSDGAYLRKYVAGSASMLLYDAARSFVVGPWYTVRVRQVGGVLSAWVDGVALTQSGASQVSDPSPLTSGPLTLYCYRAVCHFDDVVVTAP
jgi:hypothetical protein